MSAARDAISETWQTRSAPHLTGGNTHRQIARSWISAAALAGVCGVAVYGPGALGVLVVAIFSAAATDVAVGLTARRPAAGGFTHSILTGLILGLTLPASIFVADVSTPTVASLPWYVPAVGAAVAVCVKALFGGMGHCLWHPALVGRVVVQFLFWQHLSFSAGSQTVPAPVLTPGHLFVGNVSDARRIAPQEYQGWRVEHERTPSYDAFLIERPVVQLRAFTDGLVEAERDQQFTTMIRDNLPPWRDQALGTVPGGIGETCHAALIIAGFFLIYRSHLRWQLPAAILISAGLAAAILPVLADGTGESYRWLPGIAVENGRAVGVSYVVFQLTSGPLLLGAFILAGDMMLSPMRAKGQIVYGAGIGVLTIFLRLYGPVEGACYWSILVMNTLVPTIDRALRRPVLGLAS